MEERQAVANGIDGAVHAVARRFDGRARVRHPIVMLVNGVGLERISPSGPRDPPGGKDEGARLDGAGAVASIRPGSKGVLI